MPQFPPLFIHAEASNLGAERWSNVPDGVTVRLMLRCYIDAETAPLARRRTRSLAVILATITFLCTACDFVTTPSGSLPVARDYCREHGFIDGKQLNDGDELIAECSVGTTPNGGAYSIALYLDADGPADKDDATAVEIGEYDHDGKMVHTTDGTVGGD